MSITGAPQFGASWARKGDAATTAPSEAKTVRLSMIGNSLVAPKKTSDANPLFPAREILCTVSFLACGFALLHRNMSQAFAN
jgi:hypothetical protein